MAHQGESGGNMGRPSNPSPSAHFGDELAVRAAAMNTLPSQHFQPNNYYAHGWSQAQPLPPPPQAPPAPRYAALQPTIEQGDTSFMVAMAPPKRNSAAPAVGTNSYGSTSWAQPGGRTSWAWAPPAQQLPGMPPPASPVQAQPPPVTTGKKTFEEFLLEAGVLDEQTFEKIFLDELADKMLGPVERDDRFVSLGDVLLALGAVSSSSSSGAGPSTRQVRIPAQEALGAGGRDGDEAAAAEARERRSRRMAMRKEAAAKHHRPDKHAAPRGSQNGPAGAI